MMSRTAAPSSEVTTPILRGSAGSGTLAPLVEQPLAREPLLELVEGELPRAEALGLEVLADDLIFALRVVDADAAARDDAQAVLRLEAQVAKGRAEHHALDLRVGVLEREVHVPGVPHAAIRQLAFDPDFEEALLEQRADAAGQLRDGQDAARLGERSARTPARAARTLSGPRSVTAQVGSSNGRSKSESIELLC